MIEASSEPVATKHRLSEIVLDPASIGRGNANIEHEREVAIYDLLDENSFEVDGRDDGPYKLTIGIVEDRLALSVYTAPGEEGEPLVTHYLSMTPFKRIMKDYFLVLDSYYQAIRTAQPSRIQAIDVGRRGLPRRRQPRSRRAPGRQGQNRLRYRPSPLHADIGPSLEGLVAWTARATRLVRCCLRAP